MKQWTRETNGRQARHIRRLPSPPKSATNSVQTMPGSLGRIPTKLEKPENMTTHARFYAWLALGAAIWLTLYYVLSA